MVLVELSHVFNGFDGDKLSRQQDLASVGTSTQSTPSSSLPQPSSTPDFWLLRGAFDGVSTSLMVRSFQAHLFRFRRRIFHPMTKILSGPPNHLFQTLNGRSHLLPSAYTIFSVLEAVWQDSRCRRLCDSLGNAVHNAINPGWGFQCQSLLHHVMERVDGHSQSFLHHVEERVDGQKAHAVTKRDTGPAVMIDPHETDLVTLSEQVGTLQSANDNLKHQIQKLEAKGVRVQALLAETVKEKGHIESCLFDLEKLLRRYLGQRTMFINSIERYVTNWERQEQGRGATESDPQNTQGQSEEPLLTAYDAFKELSEWVDDDLGDLEPTITTFRASTMEVLEAKTTQLEAIKAALLPQVHTLRRKLFLSRKQIWTVAIVRAVGDEVAGKEPVPSLADFFPIEDGDATRLVCGPVADINASPSARSKCYRVDDLFIAESNRTIGAVILRMTYQAYWERDICFIADGQSGSGKSYTLFNGPDALAPSIAEDIFSFKRGSQQNSFTVSCTALEVYQDALTDLLPKKGSPRSADLGFESSKEGGTKVKGCCSESVRSAAELRDLLIRICQNRRVSATDENVVSSRGHLICTLTIQQPHLPRSRRTTCVVLVDLAGSERGGRSGPTSTSQKTETQYINESRSNLRRALLSVASKDKEVVNKDCTVRSPIDRLRLIR